VEVAAPACPKIFDIRLLNIPIGAVVRWRATLWMHLERYLSVKDKDRRFDQASTHKRQLSARLFDGRTAFVPEGQADRSQARSAWVVMQRVRSRGTVEVIVSPRDICRRNRVPA
jgi:hypothetical protein